MICQFDRPAQLPSYLQPTRTHRDSSVNITVSTIDPDIFTRHQTPTHTVSIYLDPTNIWRDISALIHQNPSIFLSTYANKMPTPVTASTTVPRTHYEILGVTPQAQGAEIKEAYRKRALQCHPDKNLGDGGAVVLFQEVCQLVSLCLLFERSHTIDTSERSVSSFALPKRAKHL